MIKHWEILENKWTQGSAYVLGITGEDLDSIIISKELSSFCSLTTAKVPPFTHIFELLNVNDDDILQKIRAKIEDIVANNSAKENTALNSSPLQASNGTLDFEPEGDFQLNMSDKSNDFAGNIASSSDGKEIPLGDVDAFHLQDTKTNNIPLVEEKVQNEAQNVQVKENQVEIPSEEKPQIVEAKKEEVVQPKKEEKPGFFKRLFSFGKKKNKVKEEEVSTPLPIEESSVKAKDIEPTIRVEAKAENKKEKPASDAKANTTPNMRGVVVKGTAFPVEELGAQKIKEVSLDSKNLFEKEQQDGAEVLQSQVPLDDIFAAETICQFYDEQGSSEPKIEKIVEPTPMPTPKVITITQNKILEENQKKEELAKAEKGKEDVKTPQAPTQAPAVNEAPSSADNKEEAKPAAVRPIAEQPKQPVENKQPELSKDTVKKEQKQAIPAVPATDLRPIAEQPKQPVENKQPEISKDTAKKKQVPDIPVIAAAPIVAKMADLPTKEKQEPKKPQNVTQKPVSPMESKETNNNFAGENKAKMSKVKKDDKKIPQIDVSSEETFKVKNPLPKEEDTSALPKVEMNDVELASLNKYKEEEEAKAENKEASSKQNKEQNTPQKDKKSEKPLVMPQLKDTQIDGFDHTIQTSSIPVYKKSNWSIEMPIVPSYTLDNMDMSSNRFAHAAAMTIIENPGTIYNPFFLFGEGGCGKTHFLNAVGVEFSKKLSQDKIFITNGVRFSRGIQRAIENGTIDKVRDFLDSAQVLIIDDIHLTAVNDSNREFISKVLNDFVEKRKQLVISSKYPPQGLSRFEELTNFKLDQGWISELKTLRPNHFIKTYTKMAEDAQVDLTEAQCRGFFGRENLTLGMIAKDIKRAKVLRRRIKDSGSMMLSYEQLLNYITAISGEDSTSQLESLDLSSPLSIRRGENTNWGDFGFFFPKESADKFKWVVYATMRRAKELGIKGGFNFALKSAYSTEHIIASAFKIANVCDSKNLKAAIILGPDPKIIQPAIRDNFCDILTHMLEVMMIRCAIISYEDIKKPSSYVKVLGDVLK